MKNNSANSLALLYSFIIIGFIAISLVILNSIFTLSLDWVVILIIAFVGFVLSFVVLRFLLQSFIYNRIKLIYKSVHQRKVGKTEKSEKFTHNTDLIKQVEEDVKQWADEQESEIEQIKEMSNYRREFVGNVAHELKTPIFNVQGYTLTLLEGGLEDETINRKYLYKIEKNINRMISIVNNLDAITSLESEKLKLEFNAVDPIGLCRETIESVENAAKKKDIRIKIIEHYDKQYKVLANKESIRQVFTNLLINAINYNNDSGIIKIEFYKMDNNILIEVTDNGIGIPSEDISRIFERFYRVDKSRSLNSGGSGLGLSIVKHIIEAHNQSINVRSTINIGTTIAFTLEMYK